jgi:hypothetical protein
MEPEDDESGRPRRSAGRRWLWPVLGAAALTALLAGVAAVSIGPAGRWASPRVSAGPTQPRASGPHTYRVEVCNPIPGDGDIMTCPSRSPYLPAGVTAEQYAAAKDKSPRVLQALATIDFCGPTDPVPCPSDTAPPPTCVPSPCPRRTLTRGLRRLVPGDVAVIRTALVRAGFPGTEVKLLDNAPGLSPWIRYAVPVGSICLVGIMFTTDPPRANDLSGLGPDGHC